MHLNSPSPRNLDTNYTDINHLKSMSIHVVNSTDRFYCTRMGANIILTQYQTTLYRTVC